MTEAPAVPAALPEVPGDRHPRGKLQVGVLRGPLLGLLLRSLPALALTLPLALTLALGNRGEQNAKRRNQGIAIPGCQLGAAGIGAIGPLLSRNLVDAAQARLVGQRPHVATLDLPLNPLELALKCVEGVLAVLEAVEQGLGRRHPERNGALRVVQGAPGRFNAPQLPLESEQRGLQGTDRADPVRNEELRNCALRELRAHALALGPQMAPQLEASARPDCLGAR
eukprot:514424-Alexandrium_andersonii.AAC.1